MPKIIIKKATTSTAVTANPLPNFLILRPLPLNDPRVVAGRQLQLVKIQQNNVAPIITTAGGTVQTFGGNNVTPVATPPPRPSPPPPRPSLPPPTTATSTRARRPSNNSGIRLAKANNPKGRKKPKKDPKVVDMETTLEGAALLMEMAGFPVSEAVMAAYKATAQ